MTDAVFTVIIIRYKLLCLSTLTHVNLFATRRHIRCQYLNAVLDLRLTQLTTTLPLQVQTNTNRYVRPHSYAYSPTPMRNPNPDPNLFEAKHRLLLPVEKFKPIPLFLSPLVPELGARTRQTDGQTDGRMDKTHNAAH